jgi:hypothetical protein
MRHARPNERLFAITLYEQGLPIKILSWVVGRPPQTIARWLRECGAARRRTRPQNVS